MLATINHVEINHTLRKRNCVADLIANIGLNYSDWHFMKYDQCLNKLKEVPAKERGNFSNQIHYENNMSYYFWGPLYPSMVTWENLVLFHAADNDVN